MDEQQLVMLVQAARAGDREAFGRLVVRFERVIFAIVLRRLRNRSEALEVTQDVFLRALRKLPQLRQPERFAGWLRRIAVRLSINRAVRRPREFDGAFNLERTAADRGSDPLDSLLRQEREGQVWRVLDRLRELDRRTLIAFYIQGRSLKQMSDEFASPVGTIKRRLHTARNRLRDRLVAQRTAG